MNMNLISAKGYQQCSASENVKLVQTLQPPRLPSQEQF